MRLIDADYLLGTFQAVCSAVSCEECRAKYKDGTCKVERWIKAQPTMEERKKGKWIYSDDDGVIYDSYYCSCCHQYITVDAERKCDIGFIIDDFDFCPSCGADMREEENR